jgi:hypothetical protein
MKRRATLVRCVLVAAGSCCAAVVAAAEPAVLHQGIAHDALYDVVRCARRGGGGCGRRGAGEQRRGRELAAPAAGGATALALLGLPAPTRRLAVAGRDRAGRRRNGWRKVESGTEQRLLAVAITTSGLAVAVGGLVPCCSARPRRSWKPSPLDWPALVEDFAEPHLYDVAVAEDGAITLVGEFEMVMRSPDGGATGPACTRAMCLAVRTAYRALGRGIRGRAGRTHPA